MSYEVVEDEDSSVIYLTGEVDMEESPKARKVLLECVKADKNIVVDLSGVTYIDSSGIASLVEAFQAARNAQVDFSLVKVSKSAMKVIELARLEKVFTIV